MNNKYHVRYPVGFSAKADCLCSVIEEKGQLTFLNYIEARKRIYLPVYCDLAKKQRQFQELSERLKKGENLLIIEVDGPHRGEKVWS